MYQSNYGTQNFDYLNSIPITTIGSFSVITLIL